MDLRLQKKLVVCLFFTFVVTTASAWAQVTGDYQTVAAGGALNWSDPNAWERWDGVSWVTPAPNYPGEVNGDAQTVTILSTGDPSVTLDVSPAFGIVNLAIQDGAFVELDLNASILTITGDLTLDGEIDDIVGGNTAKIFVGGDLTIGSTATIAATSAFDIEFNKASGTQTISGAYTGQFLVYNFVKTGAGTLDNNLGSGAAFDILNRFRLYAGTFLAGAVTYQLSKGSADTTFAKDGGTFTAETSTIKDNAGTTSNITVRSNSDITFYNFTTSHGSGGSLNFLATSTQDTFYIAHQYERINTGNNVVVTNSIFAYQSDATLKFSNTFGRIISLVEWPAVNGPTNIDITGSNSVTMNATTGSRSVSGTLTLRQTANNLIVSGAGVTLTVNGTLQRQSTGSAGIATASGGAIVYGASSLLDYTVNVNTNVTVGNEWTSTLTPNSVKINHSGSTNKTVTLPNLNMAVTNDLNIAAGIIASGASDKTLSVGGNVTTGTLTTTGEFAVGTLVLVGNQAQNISGGGGSSTVANLRINKTNPADVVTLQTGTLKVDTTGLLDIQNGILSLSSGSTGLDVTGATFRIRSGGTYRTGGKPVTITSATIDFQSGSTYEFNGTSTTESFITTGATTNYGNVIINNTNATPSVTVPAGNLIVIQNNLTMNNGLILSGATNSSGNIEVDGTASSSSVTSYVNGTLRIKFPSGAASRDFPIGFSSNYRPATFAYTANSVATSIVEIEALSGDPTGTAPAGIAQIATSHYYTIKEIGTGGTFTYDLTLTITGTGFVPVARNKILIQNGATPDYSFPTQGTAAGSTQSVAGLTALPTNAFKVAFGAGGAIKRWDGTSGNWSVAANWEDDALPLNGDEILLNNALQASSYTVTYNTATTATTFAKIAIAATAGVTLQLDKSTTIDLTDGTTGLDISDDADSKLVYNGTSIGMAGGGYDAAKTSIGASSTVDYRTGTVYADAYGNLIVNTTGTLNTTGATTVGGGYTKSGSGSHDVANTTFSVTGTSDILAGTFSSSGTGSVSLGAVTNAATITLSGSGASSLGAVTNSNTMTINSTAGAITFAGDYSGNGTLSATSSTPGVTFQANFSPGGNATFGSQTLQFQGDVTVTGGALTLSSNSSFTGASKDFEVSTGSIVTSAGTISFQTGASQTITGNITFPSLTINNTNGVTISSGSLPTVTGTLTLTSGLVNFSNNANYVTLNSAATVSGGSSTSYVNGKVRKVFAAGSNISGVYPVGKPTGRYQPVTILAGTVTGANQTITVEQIEVNNAVPLTAGINAPLAVVSRVRYWNVAYSSAGGSMTSPTILLSWDNSGAAGISDGIASIAGSSFSSDIVIAQQSNGTGNWNSQGQSAFTGSYAARPNANVGTVTSNAFTLTNGNTDLFTFGAISSDVSLPVELASFDAIEVENAGHVRIVWRTESELENAYWFVQKKKTNADFETIATIDGQGSKSSSTDYQFIDPNVKAGDVVTYRLVDIAYNGDMTYHPEKTLTLKVPERIELLANYPNPFNPTTTISYKLPKQSRVQLTIYNVLGQKVRELVRGESQNAGVQRVFWDSRNDAGSTVSTGIYIYRLQIGNFNTSRKMILMK